MNSKTHTLWTIQTIDAWNELQNNGFLTGKEQFIDPYFKRGYDWMKDQMKSRIEKPKTENIYPIWAWYQYQNSNKRKPDLRGTGFTKKGQEAVRIEFVKKRKSILLSDFGLWHYPLNYMTYIGSNKSDALKFKKKLQNHNLENSQFDQLPITFQNEIKTSWNKIFDMNFQDPYYTTPFDQKQIQATFWELRIDKVVKVDRFRAK